MIHAVSVIRNESIPYEVVGLQTVSDARDFSKILHTHGCVSRIHLMTD